MPSARFLDVACGTGWVTHYLAKLGLRVCGFDISEDMISLAKERMAADPWPTTDGRPLDVELFCHDIETAPLPTTEKYDVAILESALHHFVDPITSLQNLRQNLSDDGIVIIIEGSSDGVDAYCKEIMDRYDTLERPYTPDELDEILVCAGFHSQQRLIPISGFFHPGVISARSVSELLCVDQSWNTVVAFNSNIAAESTIRLQGSESPDSYLTDASGSFVTDLEREHWISSSADLVLNKISNHSVRLVFRSPIPNQTGKTQQLVISTLHPETVIQRHELHPSSAGDAEIIAELPIVNGSGSYRLRTSEVFSPSWEDTTADPRLLGGRVSVFPLIETPEHSTPAHPTSVIPSDGWMGPDSTFKLSVNGGDSVQLRFLSPIPCIRKHPQTLCITLLPGRQRHIITLKPEKGHEASALLNLTHLSENSSLRIQSSDSFNPAWDGDDDDRLLSYRLECEILMIGQ
jgi:hypothetical protein